jgi:hypothetical protein
MFRTTVAVCVALGLMVSIGLSAKGPTTKIRITGPALASPIEITDRQVLQNFGVWDWPRPGKDGFVVSYVNTSSPSPPQQWPRYEVSFFTDKAHPVYVVVYQFSQSVEKGFIYIPPTELNRTTIGRGGMEDWWLPASNAWERVARPLINSVAR